MIIHKTEDIFPKTFVHEHFICGIALNKYLADIFEIFTLTFMLFTFRTNSPSYRDTRWHIARRSARTGSFVSLKSGAPIRDALTEFINSL